MNNRKNGNKQRKRRTPTMKNRENNETNNGK